jgi:hypothetical protein
MLHRVALVRTDVSEELSASIIRVARIGELGTTLAVTNNRRTLRRHTKGIDLVCLRSVCRLLVTTSVVPSSLILVTLINEALSSSETSVHTEPHGVTSQKTPFFIVTAVKTSNLTIIIMNQIEDAVCSESSLLWHHTGTLCLYYQNFGPSSLY